MSVTCTVVDPLCFKPYDQGCLIEGAVAGTESTVMHLSAEMGWNVLQHNRFVSNDRFHPITYPADTPTFIVLRDPAVGLEWAYAHPGSQIFLWLHDLCGLGSSRAKVLMHLLPQLVARGVSIVTVSDFHRSQLTQVVAAAGFPFFPIHRIYNPVVIPEIPDCAVNPDQLVFFSSPHKGLETAVKVFAAIRRRFPSMRMLVANPGYFPSALINSSGITNLGPLPRSLVHKHVKESLCMLFPNYVYPETFGLVLAESNALGTPVLTHDIGAAAEVLADDRQVVPIPRGRMRLDGLQQRFPWSVGSTEHLYTLLGGYGAFVDRVASWRSGTRPSVHMRDTFSLDNVASQWRQLIAG